MREPEFNHFDLDEYRRRRAAAAARMQAAGLDALLVTTESNVRYLAGLLNQYWVANMHDDMQIALIPADDRIEPVLFLADHLAGGTGKTSWIDDVRVWSQFGTGKSSSPIQILVDTLVEKGLTSGRIGMEIGPGSVINMPLPRYAELRERLPRAELVDGGAVLAAVRARKSAAEIAYIREACRITCIAFDVGLRELRAGMSERELSHIIAEEALSHTDEGGLAGQWTIFVHGGRGRLNWFDGIPGEYRFQAGDPVFLDGGVTYRSYCSDFIRIGSIGPLDPAHQRLFDANRLANMEAIKHVGPGVRIGDLSRIAFDVWRDCGCAKELDEQLDADYDFLGHGLGLGIHEPPLLWSGNDAELEEGMVLALEGMLVDQMPLDRSRIALGIEENVLVTPDGHEVLTPLDNRVRVAEC